MGKTNFKRLLCLVLSLAMIFTLASFPAYAEEETDVETVIEEATEETDAIADENETDEAETEEASEEAEPESEAASEETTQTAAEAVQAQIDALPSVDAVAEMDTDEQLQVYADFLAACEAYDALSEDEQADIDDSALDDLADYFNGDMSTMDDAAVAQIGETKYTSLSDAISVASSGDTVTLLSDAELSSALTISSDITLDLDGYTITATSTSAKITLSGTIAISNGTFDMGSASTNLPGPYNTTGAFVNIASGANVTMDDVNILPTSSSDIGYPLCIIGTLTVTGGTIKGRHIYISSGGDLTINDDTTLDMSAKSGTTCYNAFQMGLGGSITINGGTIKSSMATFAKQSSGTKTAAVPNWKITITGGTFIVNEDNAYSVSAAGTSEYQNSNQILGTRITNSYTTSPNYWGDVTITGGAFNQVLALYDYYKIGNTKYYDNEDTAVYEACIAEGYYWDTSEYDTDGYYYVRKEIDPVAINMTTKSEYETLQAAIDAANDGETVAPLEDLSEDITIAAGQNVTIDLAGFTLTGDVTVSAGGALTLKDSVTGGVLIGDVTVKSTYEEGWTDETESTWGVTVTKAAFNLVNGEIQGDVTVKYGTMTMEDGTIFGGRIILYGEYTEGGTLGATLTMNGGTITGNTGATTGGVCVGMYCEFTMNDGTINGNTTSSSGNGGGVYVNFDGKFVMNGGTISDNTAFAGGGVFLVGEGSTFEMYDGAVISGNRTTSVESGAGGVYVGNGATFNMLGGTIKDNSTDLVDDYYYQVTEEWGDWNWETESYDTETVIYSYYLCRSYPYAGGGVSVIGGTFNMSGGTISGNSATHGGGVVVGGFYERSGVYCGGTFNMSGGSITGNTALHTGGGVYLYDLSSSVTAEDVIFTVSGDAVISDNVAQITDETVGDCGIADRSTDASDNNVYLPDGYFITLAGDLIDGAAIGVTTESAPTEDAAVQVTSSENGTTYYEGAVDYFTSDDDGYAVQANDSGYLELAVETKEFAGATLLFEDIIQIQYYFTPDSRYDADKVDAAGLVVWEADDYDADGELTLDNATYATATGFSYDSNYGYYYVITKGIPAKNMGDSQYVRYYYTIGDTTYYSNQMLEYSPKKYAYNQIDKANTIIADTESGYTDAYKKKWTNMKALAIALLNYGAEAQKYFDYPTGVSDEDLMNADLGDDANWDYGDLLSGYSFTTDEKAMDGVEADATNIALYARAAVFKGALELDIYFTISDLTVDEEDTDVSGIIYWNASDYANVESLSATDCSGIAPLTANGSHYYGTISGIAAKNLDDIYYVCAYATDDDGNIVYGKIYTYSVYQYAAGRISKESTSADLCKTLVIYGEAAKTYFNNLAD